MTKKVVCWIAILISNFIVIALCWRLLDTSNKFMLSMYVIAPVCFTLPWLVILKGED